MASSLFGPKGFLVVAGVCAAAWVATAARAQVIPNPKANGKARQAMLYAPIIKELRQTHHLLELANHDYGGHRVKAAQEIHKAVQILAHGFHKPNAKKAAVGVQPLPAPPVLGPKGPPLPENQAVSDAQLRQAAKQVAAAISQLTSMPPTRRARAAVPLLQEAIAQIEQGLAFVQKNPPPPVLVK
jgi:hypothetical protein